MGMDITGQSGNYFRASVWSWRPIAELIEVLNTVHSLGFNLEYFHTNDGAGLDTQEDCNKLADLLEEGIGAASDDEELYLPSGMYVERGTGRFAKDTEVAAYFESLNLPKLPFEPESKTQALVAETNSTKDLKYVPAHSVSAGHLREFITFLRECGGKFEIF